MKQNQNQKKQKGYVQRQTSYQVKQMLKTLYEVRTEPRIPLQKNYYTPSDLLASKLNKSPNP